MKQSVLKHKMRDWQDSDNGYPEIECIKEIIIILKSDDIDPFEYAEAYDYDLGGWSVDNKSGERCYRLIKIHKIPPTVENKIAVRNRFNMNSPAYACCVACGKVLHIHQKQNHFESKFGLIGPECFKKYGGIL